MSCDINRIGCALNNLNLPILIVITILLILSGYVSHYFLGRNNPIEEIVEQVLNNQYGVDVEFSGDK